MSIFDIKLDTTSDYMCNDELWPLPCCDVMIESELLTDVGYTLFGAKPENAYIDIYAVIDPERRFVTEFQLFLKNEDGTQDNMNIKVTAFADKVQYYKVLEKQGGDEFKKFIAGACILINPQRCEYRGRLVDIVDDFLEKKGVRIPSSDAELMSSGEECGSVRIYGADYDELASAFEATLKLDPQSATLDRLKALQWWAEEYVTLKYSVIDRIEQFINDDTLREYQALYTYTPDETAFYTELKEDEFTLEELEKACGKAFADSAKAFWLKHGLM